MISRVVLNGQKLINGFGVPGFQSLRCGFNNIDSLILCSNSSLTYINFEAMPQLENIYIPDTAQPPNYYSSGSPNFQFVSCNLLNVDIQYIPKLQIKIYPNPVENQITIRSMAYLCLSYDHRFIDGTPAVKFLQKIKQLLQNPKSLITQL